MHILGEETPALRPHLTWAQVIRLAQSSLADAVVDAIAGQRLDRGHYQHWLAMEAAVSLIGAGVLERLGDWHQEQPQLRATALEWATSLRHDALTAAADVRALDGIAPAPPPQLGRWRVYAESACRSMRAGEALGTVLLHARLLDGQAGEAAQLALELPFLATHGRGWLLRRARPEPARIAGERENLIQAWSAAALAVGSQRAAVWHREALAQILGPRASPNSSAPMT